MSRSITLASLAATSLALSCSGSGGNREPAHPEATAAQPKCPPVAAAQAPAPATGSYEDRGVTFVARSPRLEWQKSSTARELEFKPAEVYCKTLNLDGGGWRLPTRDELRALLNDITSGTGPSFKVPGLDSDEYWSSTPRTDLEEKDKPSVWLVNFREAEDFSAEFYFRHKARCVRPPR